MTPTAQIAIYAVLIVIGSLLGGWAPSMFRLTHARMQIIVSFVAGLMLGVGLWHMLPHSVGQLGSLDDAVGWMMFGLLGMFFLIRVFHFHQHEVGIDNGDVAEQGHSHADCDHAGHVHHASEGHTPAPSAHRLSWIGIALGLAVHTLIDGVALAAAVVAEAHEHSAAAVFGLGTFLAVFLHKPLDALSITSLMLAGGWSPRARQMVNLGFALMCPLGAALFVLSVDNWVSESEVVVGSALAFAAGTFLCISLADLLPELQFHSHDRAKLSISLLLGVALAYGIGFLEPAGLHGHHVHDQPPASQSHGHDDHQHD